MLGMEVHIIITNCFIIIVGQLYCSSQNTVTTSNSAQGLLLALIEPVE